jgi:hypothetical protein
MLEWFTQHPESIVSISSAVISAAVAFSVVIISHWATSRRERIEHLITKLEELYLLLNKAGEVNGDKCLIVLDGQSDPNKLLTTLQTLDDVYCHKLYKKMIMYVRLYFPQLSSTHQQLFQKQVQLNKLIMGFLSSGVLPNNEMVTAFGVIGEYLRKMEEEIINNQAVLVGKKSILIKYIRAT